MSPILVRMAAKYPATPPPVTDPMETLIESVAQRVIERLEARGKLAVVTKRKPMGQSLTAGGGQPREWEYHYSPGELAARWKVDVSTIRDWFRDEPGVLRAGHDDDARKRAYVTLRIPESVARRVYEKHSRNWAQQQAIGRKH